MTHSIILRYKISRNQIIELKNLVNFIKLGLNRSKLTPNQKHFIYYNNIQYYKRYIHYYMICFLWGGGKRGSISFLD